MSSLVTKHQLLIERKMQDIYFSWKKKKEISRNEALNKINTILDYAINKGIFTKDDMNGYLKRRDKTKPRDHLEFIGWLEASHADEGKIFDYFIKYLEASGFQPQWKNHGSDDNGFIIIANFNKRKDSPNKPDKLIRWIKKGSNEYTSRKYVEVKNMSGDVIWLKVNNLKNYEHYQSSESDEEGTYLLIRFKSRHYFCSKKLISKLLEKKNSAIKRHGKPSILISEEGDNAHFSLKKLIDQNLIKEI